MCFHYNGDNASYPETTCHIRKQRVIVGDNVSQSETTCHMYAMSVLSRLVQPNISYSQTSRTARHPSLHRAKSLLYGESLNSPIYKKVVLHQSTAQQVSYIQTVNSPNSPIYIKRCPPPLDRAISLLSLMSYSRKMTFITPTRRLEEQTRSGGKMTSTTRKCHGNVP